MQSLSERQGERKAASITIIVVEDLDKSLETKVSVGPRPDRCPQSSVVFSIQAHQPWCDDIAKNTERPDCGGGSDHCLRNEELRVPGGKAAMDGVIFTGMALP